MKTKIKSPPPFLRVDYYKGLIEFRKAHPALRMTTYADINSNFEYLLKGTEDEDAVVAYSLKAGANGDSANGIVVILNPSANNKEVSLPEGNWDIYVNAQKAGTEVLGTATGKVSVEPLSGMILVKAGSANSDNTGNNGTTTNNGTASTNNLAPNQSVKTGDNYMAVALILALLVACAGIVVVVRKRKYN